MSQNIFHHLICMWFTYIYRNQIKGANTVNQNRGIIIAVGFWFGFKGWTIFWIDFAGWAVFFAFKNTPSSYKCSLPNINMIFNHEKYCRSTLCSLIVQPLQSQACVCLFLWEFFTWVWVTGLNLCINFSQKCALRRINSVLGQNWYVFMAAKWLGYVFLYQGSLFCESHFNESLCLLFNTIVPS